jgi:NADH dehydrogenase [ubiquinone] 1 alpha subcomplex assembly factor 4
LLNKGKLDPATLDHLSKVYIKSEGDNPVINSSRRLPQDRKSPLDFEFGYEEPKMIPKGKTTMRNVLEILSKHQTEPNVETIEKLAKDYNMDLVDVANIVQYFKPFEVIMPKKAEEGPRLNPARLLQQKMDQLKE